MRSSLLHLRRGTFCYLKRQVNKSRQVKMFLLDSPIFKKAIDKSKRLCYNNRVEFLKTVGAVKA